MTDAPTTDPTSPPDGPVLVRIVRGSVGPMHPEDGMLVALAADVAADLIEAGDAVPVALPDGTTTPRLSMTLAALQENER